MPFWNSLAFLMIQRMLAIWSLVPLPFLKPAWTSGSSRFTYNHRDMLPCYLNMKTVWGIGCGYTTNQSSAHIPFLLGSLSKNPTWWSPSLDEIMVPQFVQLELVAPCPVLTRQSVPIHTWPFSPQNPSAKGIVVGQGWTCSQWDLGPSWLWNVLMVGLEADGFSLVFLLVRKEDHA